MTVTTVHMLPAIVFKCQTLGLGMVPLSDQDQDRAKEGFGALVNKSQSAPPIPRDQVGKPPVTAQCVSKDRELQQQ
jgi:hypothetical protein